ncbi:MAG: HAD family hydrolase [Bacteroidetes bacterium]|nr:HAD family hydrolase [Bacteroidota bacterium]MCB0844685.1 HAD family hydrolase [Bacteroidota bacterium]
MSKIFVSDLDGTLLKNDACLSDYSRKNLEMLLAKEIPFSVATARSVVTVRHVLGNLPLRLPVVCSNGAYITDFQSGERLFVNSMDSQIVDEIIRMIRRVKGNVFLSTFDGTEDKLYLEPIQNEGMKWYRDNRIFHKDPRLNDIKNCLDHLHESIICINFIERPEVLKEIESELERIYGDQLVMYIYDVNEVPGWNWLSIYDRRATKARAIQHLIESLGYETEHLTVFGDHLNDISMFEMAGWGVATGNARSELKAIASEVIGTNETDSVVKYLLKVTAHHDWV